MTLSLLVTRIRDLTPAIKAFDLAAPDGGELPAFMAGAHIDIAVTQPDGSSGPRSYSIASDPAVRRRYEIAVLREPMGSGGSAFMHERVRVGDTLLSTLPSNDFPLAEGAARHLLIAGGIGITPILSMARVLAASGAEFALHYCARNPAEMPYRAEVETLCGPRATLHFDGGDAVRWINLTRLLFDPQPGAHAYVCGPKGMITRVRDIARGFTWPTGTVHFEFFNPAAAMAGDTEIEVVLQRAGRTIMVPADVTILDALIAAGADSRYDCKRGECGMCATDLIDGVPLHRDYYLSDAEKSAGKSLCICISRAMTKRLVLDL